MAFCLKQISSYHHPSSEQTSNARTRLSYHCLPCLTTQIQLSQITVKVSNMILKTNLPSPQSLCSHGTTSSNLRPLDRSLSLPLRQIILFRSLQPFLELLKLKHQAGTMRGAMELDRNRCFRTHLQHSGNTRLSTSIMASQDPSARIHQFNGLSCPYPCASGHSGRTLQSLIP